MPSEIAEALVGGLSLVGTLLSLGTCTTNERSDKVHWGTRLFSATFLLVDVADIVFDFMFSAKLRRLSPNAEDANDEEDDGVTKEESWANLVLIFTSVSCFTMIAGKVWIRKVANKKDVERQRLNLNVLRTICAIEFLSYVFEDTTSIMAYTRVEGAYDPGSISDKINIALSALSGILVACGPLSLLGTLSCETVCCKACDWVRDSRQYMYSYEACFYRVVGWMMYILAALVFASSLAVPIGVATFYSYVALNNVIGQVAVVGTLYDALRIIYIMSLAIACTATGAIVCWNYQLEDI